MQSPVASLGRNFCFCASVPYQTMGKVPMPTWALKATEKLPSCERWSATMAEVTLSMARPPYASGMSTAIRPRSPAFLRRARVTSKCLASISSAAGSTSLRTNSEAVRAIWRCSSVKSSGVMMSSGADSPIRKLPPGTVRCSISVAVANVPPGSINGFENARGAHASTDTHGHQSVP